MISKIAGYVALAGIASLTLGLAGCGSTVEDDAEASEGAASMATLTAGSFTLYGTPRHQPTGCDSIVRLTLDPANRTAEAKMSNAINGFCAQFVEPDAREYKLTATGDDCGSKIYSGKRAGRGPATTIVLTDHRTRRCRDTVDARIIVEETQADGVKRMLYSGDSAGPAPSVTTKWLSFSPKQCNTNPWNLVDNGPGTGPETLSVVQYYESIGIKLNQVGFVDPVGGAFACESCGCARGDRLVVEAKTADDATKLLVAGFKPLAGALTTSPKQCGTNPWQDGTTDEDKALGSWAAANGAELAEAGFVNQIEPTATCAACSCPRGDTAIAIPKTTAGGDALAGLGWQRLP